MGLLQGSASRGWNRHGTAYQTPRNATAREAKRRAPSLRARKGGQRAVPAEEAPL